MEDQDKEEQKKEAMDGAKEQAVLNEVRAKNEEFGDLLTTK